MSRRHKIFLLLATAGAVAGLATGVSASVASTCDCGGGGYIASRSGSGDSLAGFGHRGYEAAFEVNKNGTCQQGYTAVLRNSNDTQNLWGPVTYPCQNGTWHYTSMVNQQDILLRLSSGFYLGNWTIQIYYTV